MSVVLPLLLALYAQDPLAGQLPKQDLGVEAFLAAHPEYDGRGIRVAILDTGIDPGHPFLQRTPDGRRKVVDWYDATTDGRVDTSRRAQAQDGTLIGGSGRRLQLGKHDRAGREFRIGRVGMEFLPGDLQARLTTDRQTKWNEGRRYWQEARARLEASGGSLDENDARQMEEKLRWEEFNDPGPCWDLIAWQEADGEWRVVVDQDEDGDLGEESALRPFRGSGDWAVLGQEALLHYAVDVEAEGERVVLYFDSNGHGTHVAGIVGGWEGPTSRLNGIAPGVEFVAIKIGDGKYGGSTSGFAIAKALDLAVKAGCQVANMSFGGPSFFADGREPEAQAVAEAARRGLFLVCSAGNEGPTLSTVGAPGTVPYALSVAAAIWPDTQRANYASIRPADTVMFDFSSRGPLPSGSLGVDFVAPGAALSSLPAWTLTLGENFNGTSMASPQMAGCVALLLSGAKAEQLPQEWARIYRALRLAAEPLAGFTWADFGHGAIQMDRALDALRALSDCEGATREYEVEINNPFGVGTGVYERQLAHGGAFDRTVRIAPHFDHDASNAERAATLRTLRVHAEAAWIQVPDAIHVNSAGRSFTMRVDPEHLKPGLHVSRVLLQDADQAASAGPDVVIPVTLVLAERAAVDGRYTREFQLGPGGLERCFLAVPFGARRAHVEIEQRGGPRNELRTGAGSVSGFTYAGDRQARGRYLLADGETAAFDVPVEAGTIWEMSIAARWSSNGLADYQLRVRFDGLAPDAESVFVPAGQDLAYIGVRSLLRDVNAEISGSVDGVAVAVTAPMKILPDPIHPVIFGELGMFVGVVEQEFQVPDGGSTVGLHIGHSIQSTEAREDLMIEVFDSVGAVIARSIAFEVDTDLGRLDAGSYLLRMTFPAIGKAPLEAGFAGAELRFATGGGKLQFFHAIGDALSGAAAGPRSAIPVRGARSFYGKLPRLAALPAGRSYYGSIALRTGTTALLTLPLRIERPSQAGTASEPVPGSAIEPSKEEVAWTTAVQDPASTGATRISAARAWATAAPRDPRAALAVLATLQNAGLPEAARTSGRDFLKRFPRQVEAFVAEASRWQ